MSRSRRTSRCLIAAAGSVANLALAPVAHAFQTALQPATVVPTGRVCSKRNFGDPADGANVDPVLFQNPNLIALGADKNLYSTSPSGGATGAGTIFHITPAGALTVMHPFVHFDPKDGAQPLGGLVDGHDGYFYGTTYAGGKGPGTIFRIRPTDTKPEILYKFRNSSVIGLLPPCPPTYRCSYSGRQRADAAAGYPTSAPVVAPGGVLYGVTPYSNNQQYGVLWTMAPPYDTLSFHALCIFDQRMLADPDMKPFVCKAKSGIPTILIAGSGGALYGLTVGGNGTVFRATTGGDVTTIHEFTLEDGVKPTSLMMASNGLLYGTNYNGGATGGGTVFRLDGSGGDFTVMSSFRSGTWLQGLNPAGGLVELQPPGSLEPFLFGTTRYGGKNGRGMLFRIPLKGDETSLRVLHDFDMYTTGRSPMSVPAVGPDGWLYGLTYQGGKFDSGVLYALNPIVLNDLTTRDAYITSTVRAVNDNKQPIQDPIVDVLINATAQQSGVDATGKVVVNALTDGIMVRGRCPNAHIVQFIARERFSPQNARLPGLDTSSSGIYPLTTDAANIQWHTDTPGYFDFPVGPYQRNAYLDQGVGAGHTSTPAYVTIFDRPGFGVFDDPKRPSSIYLATNQNVDLTKSETWRATARDFLICDCKVTKEIWWAREVRGGKASFTHISVVNPAADALSWINAQLKRDGYAAIP